MEAVQDVSTSAAESSTAAVAVPTDPQEYADWRVKGPSALKARKAPAEGDKSKAASTPAESRPGEQPGEKRAPASEAGKGTQEQKPRSDAATRLEELLSDLRTAGLTPAELKTFRRNAQAEGQKPPSQEGKPPAGAEHTEKPAGLEAPKRPKQEEFKTWGEYQEAYEKWASDNTAYEVQKALQEDRRRQHQDAQARELKGKLDDAAKRYGAESGKTIIETAKAINGDKQIPEAVKAILEESPVLVDLMYTIGSKPEDRAAFVELARTNPAAAIRKAVLMEGLVQAELAKGGSGGKGAQAGAAGGETPERGADGKFKAPGDKGTQAPPPPREVGAHGGAPPDEVEQAGKKHDFASFRNAANRRDLARAHGR